MTPDSLQGHVLDGKYRIDQQLGRGGMGAVYLAVHLGTERPVALKVITEEFTNHPEALERFKREAKAAGRLRHPNVVNVTDFGFASFQSKQIAYLVMEYLDGATLSDTLRQGGQMTIEFVVDIVEQICLAIDKAHQQGTIHRDLKPDNIWLEPNGRGGYNVKVLDFGIAKLYEEGLLPAEAQPGTTNLPSSSPKPQSVSENGEGVATELITADIDAPTIIQPQRATDESDIQAPTLLATAYRAGDTDATIRLPAGRATAHDASQAATLFAAADNRTEIEPASALTQVGAVLGTPFYMSPEQCRGEELDPGSDIYSLGVISYQMLGGELPFSGDSPYDVLRQHMLSEPPPLRDKRPEVPKRLAELIESALAKKSADRPMSAAAFAAALRARAEGAGALSRDAAILYSRHFGTLFFVSLRWHTPMIAVTILLFIDALFLRTEIASIRLGPVPVIWIVLFLSLLFGVVTLCGLFVRIVPEMLLYPLNPFGSRALNATKFSALSANLGAYVGMLKTNLSSTDSRGSGLKVVLVTSIVGGSVGLFFGLYMGATDARNGFGDGLLVGLGLLSPLVTALSILFDPVLCLVNVMMYLKARRARGETLKQIAGEQ